MSAMDTKVWVVVEGRIELVDSAPLGPERLDNGHFWLFDNFASDMDAPYSCGLCGEPQWKAYGEPCKEARPLDDLNAERAAWIAERRFDGEPVWQVLQPFARAA